jgi:hypothetical protein
MHVPEDTFEVEGKLGEHPLSLLSATHCATGDRQFPDFQVRLLHGTACFERVAPCCFACGVVHCLCWRVTKHLYWMANSPHCSAVLAGADAIPAVSEQVSAGGCGCFVDSRNSDSVCRGCPLLLKGFSVYCNVCQDREKVHCQPQPLQIFGFDTCLC